LGLPPATGCSVIVAPQPPPPDYHPDLREFFFEDDGRDDTEGIIPPRERQYWCFMAGAGHLDDLLSNCATSDDHPSRGLSLAILSCSNAAERVVQFAYGRTRLALRAQALLTLRWEAAAGAAVVPVPVLAFLHKGERLARSEHQRPYAGRADMQFDECTSGWDGDDISAPSGANPQPPPPPPPYGLALLIGMAQRQYRVFSRLANPPDDYKVRSVCLSLISLQVIALPATAILPSVLQPLFAVVPLCTFDHQFSCFTRALCMYLSTFCRHRPLAGQAKLEDRPGITSPYSSTLFSP
jgi:hypothetical protein